MEARVATVLITGTSKGIGHITALTLARAGHTVYVTLRNPGRATELAAEFAQLSLPIHVSVMDVDSDDSVTAAIAAVYQVAGDIDVLVNNAGVERNGSIEELSMADIRACMETNYFGAIRCAKAVIPHMRRRRSGCIINVTSVAGRVSTSPLGVYAASKHALEAASEALAQEMKTFNVRVAVVEPDSGTRHRRADAPRTPGADQSANRIAQHLRGHSDRVVHLGCKRRLPERQPGAA